MRRYLFGDTKYNAGTGKWKQQGGGGVGGSGAPMFAEYALGPLWEVCEGVLHAAALVGLKSELFVDEALGRTNRITYNKRKMEHAKIEATTPEMEWVVSTLQAGSATPSAILPWPGTSNAVPLPRTTRELDLSQMLRLTYWLRTKEEWRK